MMLKSTARRKRSDSGYVRVLVHRLFGGSFYENLSALMDEQISEMMKDPEFRRCVEDFNVRMFDVMARVARRHMSKQ